MSAVIRMVMGIQWHRALFLVAVACSEHKSAPIAPKPTCATVAGVFARVYAASRTIGGAASESCTSDSWPVSVIDCAITCGSGSACDSCLHGLSEAQQDHYEYRIARAENRRDGWACARLGDEVATARSCAGLTTDDRDALQEMDAAAVDGRAVMQNPNSDAATRQRTELRCISIRRLVRQRAAHASCAPPAQST